MNPHSTPRSEQGRVGPHLDEDRILDLLLGLLPASELEDAGRHLTVCRDCEDLVRRRGAQIERRRASPEAARLLGLNLATDHQSRDSRQRMLDWLTGAFHRPVLAAGLTCGILAIAVLAVTILGPHPRRGAPFPAFGEWLPSAAETLNLRSEEDSGHVPDIAAGLEAYDRRDLPEAIRALSSARGRGTVETMRLVFLGSALTQAGEYSQAVRVLRSCPLTKIPEPWRGEGNWSLLVALHGAGHRASADSLLKALAKEQSVVGGRARRLLGLPDP